MKKKLAIVITNRSSYNRVKTIIRNLPAGIVPCLILGSSVFLYKYGNVIDNIKNDFPDIERFRINMAVEGDTVGKMPKTVGVGVIEIATLLELLRPDAVITIADRFETMATAIAASYMNIPLIHIQGGETSGTIDDKVRDAITQLSDYHFPATATAAINVSAMNKHALLRVNTFNYGCPSMDLLSRAGRLLPSELGCMVNKRGTGQRLDFNEKFIIVMLHPDTVKPITSSQMDVFIDILSTVDIQKVIFWNNIDPGGEQIAKAYRESKLGSAGCPTRFIRHIDPGDFGTLLSETSCIIGNSSSGIREATYMGTPSLSVGSRQDGRVGGENITRCGFDHYDLLFFLNQQLKSKYEQSNLFGVGNAGKLIASKIWEILK